MTQKNHIALAEPFLQAGLPVYVDKPIALSRSALDKLIALTVRPGQIFSCSALRYAEELRLNEIELQTLGPLRLISASTPKYWDTYAAHLIDPLLANILPNGRAVRPPVYSLARRWAPACAGLVRRCGEVVCINSRRFNDIRTSVWAAELSVPWRKMVGAKKSL